MLLLALDSADATCSAALWDSARPAPAALLGHRRLAPGRGQADHLIALIDDLLRALGLDYRALDLLAVNHGPGSFTGVRSAVAAARGLALAAGLPVLAVGSLEALAAAVPDGSGDAAGGARRPPRRGLRPGLRSAAAAAGRARASDPEQAVAELAAGPLRLVGSGAGLIRERLPEPAGRARS